MPIDELFTKQLEAAVAEVVVEAAPELETPNADNGTKAADDVGAAAVSGEAGDTGATSTDGTGASSAEAGSAGEGDGKAVEPVIPASTPAASISDSALTLAVQHGIPIEEARLFPNDTVLHRAISAVRKSIEQLAPKDEKKTEETDLLAKLPTLDKDQYEPEVIATLEAYRDALKAQDAKYKELAEKIDLSSKASEESKQKAAEREIASWFDSQIVKLGDDFKDVLGIGGTDALSPTSAQKAKRDEIANQAAILFAGYNATGHATKSRDEIFAQAAKIVLADDYVKLAEKKLTADLHKRSKQHINRVGGNQKAKAGGDPAELAAAELKKLFPQLG